MSGIAIFVFALVSVGLIYWFIVRPWLLRIPSLATVYKDLDEKEAGLWAKLRVSLSGLKRQLFSRIVWVSGLLLTVHEFLAANLSVFTPLIKQEYQIYILPVMTVLGGIFEWLSHISPTPVGQVNPGVIASVTSTPIEVVAQQTAPDPVVANPTTAQLSGTG